MLPGVKRSSVFLVLLAAAALVVVGSIVLVIASHSGRTVVTTTVPTCDETSGKCVLEPATPPAAEELLSPEQRKGALEPPPPSSLEPVPGSDATPVPPPRRGNAPTSPLTTPPPDINGARAPPLLFASSSSSANGRLSLGELAPATGGVASPDYPGTGQLANAAAAAWNRLAVQIHDQSGYWIESNGADSMYRPLARQEYWRSYWCGRGACQNAAVPGTSNHGWGWAVDTPAATQAAIHAHPGFGWSFACSDAPWEPWHLKWCGGWSGPDPGPYGKNAFNPLSRGSTGKRVKTLSTKLALLRRTIGKHPHYIAWKRRGIHFDGAIAFGVRRFQRDCGLGDDGVYGPATDTCMRHRWNAHKRSSA